MLQTLTITNNPVFKEQCSQDINDPLLSVFPPSIRPCVVSLSLYTARSAVVGQTSYLGYPRLETAARSGDHLGHSMLCAP